MSPTAGNNSSLDFKFPSPSSLPQTRSGASEVMERPPLQRIELLAQLPAAGIQRATVFLP
ncbi:MAG: hypothetical protein U9Q81_08930 [Pseudomonadota bacterium]|nr:hypothetical protein [Pseudomonadota bacterium]